MRTLPYSVGKLLERAIARVRRLYLIRGFATVGIVWLLAVAAVMVVDSRTVIFDDRIRWAMSLGALLAALLTAMLALVIPLRRRLDFGRMARLLDARHPEFEERLSTLVELSESDPHARGFSASLFALVGEMAEADVAKVDLAKDFPAFAARRRLAVFSAFALALVVSIAVSPQIVGRLFVRAVAPWADIGNLFANDIAVKPGDVVALSGTVIRIEASKNDSSEPLNLSTAQPLNRTTAEPLNRSTAEPLNSSIRLSRKTPHGWSDETVEPMANGVYETTADPNEREWRYRVNAGRAVTRYYYVRVSQMPKYDLFKATVTYPAYTGLRPLVVTNEEVGAIKAIQGSHVKFDLRVSDPDTLADFKIGKAPVFEHTMVSNKTVNWSLDLVNRDGFRAEKGSHPLTSFIDQPPTVVIEKPTGTLRLPPHAKIPVEITANDDIAITSAYFRVSIDGEPWERHYGTKISLPSSSEPLNRSTAEPHNSARFLRTVADVDLSLYDLIFAKSISFDVVVADACPPEYGGPHSATSTPFTVQFAANEASWEIRELKNEVEDARRDIDEARKRLADAENVGRRVRDTLRREQKVSESTERESERLAHELAEAEKRIEELRDEFLADERFAPLTRPLDRLLDETLKPALEEIEEAPFREREERADTVDDALPQMEKARQELDDFAKQLAERAEKVDAFEKARDLAARQEALSKAANELLKERPLDTSKLEAWKRLEEAAMQKAEELARRAPDSDFAEAKRKMETAAREMAELKKELDEAKAESDRLAKAAAAEAQQSANRQLRQSQEIAQAAAEQQRALEALAKTNLTAAAQSQKAAESLLKKADALPAVKALQDLASEAATLNRLTAEPQNRSTAEPLNRLTAEPLNRLPSLAQTLQQAAAEAAKAEQALHEALANPTNKVEKNALEKLDQKLRAGLPKLQSDLAAAKAVANPDQKTKDATRPDRMTSPSSESPFAKDQAAANARADAAAAQQRAQRALDAVAAARQEAEKQRQNGVSPLDQKKQSALKELAATAAKAAKEADKAQNEASNALRKGDATEGTKDMQKLADKAASASQKAAHDVARAERAASAQKAASKALGEEQAIREAMARGEKTSADLEAHDRAAQAEAKRLSDEFERAEKAAAASDQSANRRLNAQTQDLRQAVADQKRAANAIQRKDLRQAAEAQRAAEDRLERDGATDGVKALQQLATTAARNAAKAPQTKEKFDLAAAAQQAATEALENELKVREGMRRGEMTEDDLAALDNQLKEGLLKMASERTAAQKAAADGAFRKAKDAFGSEDTDNFRQLADAALEAARDAVSAELSESKLRHDDARADELRGTEDAIDAVMADAADGQALEERIRGLQQSAAEALQRNDRNRAANLQRDIARAQARAADATEGEDAVAARTEANAAQQAAADALGKAARNWNDATKAEAIAAQKAASEKEAAAQDEARAVRAMNKLSAAQQAAVRPDQTTSPSSDQTIEQSEQSNNLNAPATAAADAADAMDREVNAQATALGMSKKRSGEQDRQGAGKDKGDEKSKGGGGGVSAEVSALAKELQRKDSPDFFKNLFSRLGWFKIRGLSKDGLGARDLKDVPREYRDLVRRYFLKLSEENP